MPIARRVLNRLCPLLILAFAIPAGAAPAKLKLDTAADNLAFMRALGIA